MTKSKILLAITTCFLAVAGVAATHAVKINTVTGYYYTAARGSKFTALVNCATAGLNTCKIGGQTVYSNTARTDKILYTPE